MTTKFEDYLHFRTRLHQNLPSSVLIELNDIETTAEIINALADQINKNCTQKINPEEIVFQFELNLKIVYPPLHLNENHATEKASLTTTQEACLLNAQQLDVNMRKEFGSNLVTYLKTENIPLPTLGRREIKKINP